MSEPVTRATRYLRAVGALRLIRRSSPHTPDEAVAEAAVAWRTRGYRMFGELMILRNRAVMMKGADGEDAWAVTEAALADVIVRLVESELRDAKDAGERTEWQRLLTTLAAERDDLAGSPQFEDEVAASVHRILDHGE